MMGHRTGQYPAAVLSNVGVSCRARSGCDPDPPHGKPVPPQTAEAGFSPSPCHGCLLPGMRPARAGARRVPILRRCAVRLGRGGLPASGDQAFNGPSPPALKIRFISLLERPEVRQVPLRERAPAATEGSNPLPPPMHSSMASKMVLASALPVGFAHPADATTERPDEPSAPGSTP